MQQPTTPIAQDLVFVGGGHTHAIVLRMFGMKPLPGVRLTLITDASDTPYSGMLPGHVAGFYSRDECHIDLRPLAQFAGAQLYVDRAIGLDLEAKRVLCADRPPVGFDWLSIDIGSTPKLPAVLGDLSAVIPAKPVRSFLEQWNRIVQQVTDAPEVPISVAIVGGGAGGVELALNMQQRLQAVLREARQPLANLTLHLLHRGETVLTHSSPWVQQHFHQLLSDRGIQLHLQTEVTAVQPGQVIGASGWSLDCDAIVWVTEAAAPDWLGKSGLSVTATGFVEVDDCLRSRSHPQVFAAGDVATMVNHPRPKAGVFAVRQGKPLFHNLRRALQGRSLQPFQPQRQYLSLIGTGTGEAVATRGQWGFQSPLLWRWKDRIDRAFMQRFQQLPSGMSPAPSSTPTTTPPAPMYCAGCGAKVGSSVLERSLRRLQQEMAFVSRPDVLVGLDAPDDAAVIQVPAGMSLVQTIDYFTALVNDPFIFGQISTHHALSDLFAMGAEPQSALAIATIPHANAAQAEETLYQLLAGALTVLQAADAALIGGHTIAGPDLAFGLSCNGLALPDRLLRKGGMQLEQALILTQAIGTGALFAAQMRLQARGAWIDGAIAAMLQSNQPAAQCFLAHGAVSCTDVTGFGLVGHLLEMVRASQVGVKLELDAIPLLAGALAVVEQGIASSLHPQNLQAAHAIANLAQLRDRPQFPLLFDPQTSGGLLAAVPIAQSDACLTQLKQRGYTQSCIIGHTWPVSDRSKPITIAV